MDLKLAMDLSKLGIGTSNISSLGRSLSTKEASKLFELAYDLNVRVIDTADTYGSGDSERLIAKSINGNQKNKFFIITKAGFPYSSMPAILSPLNQISKKIIQKTGRPKNFSGRYLEKSLYKSLKRLKRESVDAFVLHEPVTGDNVTDECWLAFEKIKKSGMAKYTGISSNDFSIIQDGVLSGQVEIVETSVSCKVESHTNIISFCKSKNVPIIANQIFLPLKYINEEKAKLIKDTVSGFGYQDLPLRDILISYPQSLEGIASTLLGTTNLNHLSENVKAAEHILPISLISKINQIFNS